MRDLLQVLQRREIAFSGRSEASKFGILFGLDDLQLFEKLDIFELNEVGNN